MYEDENSSVNEEVNNLFEENGDTLNNGTGSGHIEYVISDVEEADDDSGEEEQMWSDPTYKKSEEGSFRSPNYYGERSGYDSYKSTIYEAPKPEKPKKQKKKMPKAVRIVALILVCAFVSAASAWFVIDYRINSLEIGKQVIIGSPTVSPGATGTKVTHTGDALTRAQIYALSLNQVVGINSETTKNIFGQTTSRAVSGSGFVISDDGYILTNYHVVEYTVNYDYSLTVLFNDGKTYPAKIVGYEEANDIAVIKIDASGLSPVTFAATGSMSVGDMVFPVGNPLGELSYTMTVGYISALDRIISTDTSTKINMFQIDAAVNKGNSGGPVYNEYGEVLGIVTAKYSDTGVEGLGFAIPIDDVLDLVTQLIETGYIGGKAQLGVTVQTMDATFASYYNVPEGAYIREVNEGSCAEKAGIHVGDIITKANGKDVRSKEDLISILKECTANETISVTIYRSGKTSSVRVTLDEKRPDTNSTAE